MRAILTGILAATVGGAPCPLCRTEAAAQAPAAVWSTGPTAGPQPEAPADTIRVRLTIRGMTCGSCAVTARLALQRVDGVHRAEVSYDSASAVVWYDSTRTSPDVFIAKLRAMTGYEARVEEPGRREKGPRE